MDNRRFHSILASPWEYRVIGFNFQQPADSEDPFLELTLAKPGSTVKLRFAHPTDIWIERGFPDPTGGLCILDVSERQMEGKYIEVTDFEPVAGQMHFYAAAVTAVS